MTSQEAFSLAMKNGYNSVLEEVAYKEPRFAYEFARYVPGADIEKCQEGACRDPGWAYMFARFVEGADINKCKIAVSDETGWRYLFSAHVN